VAFDEAVVQTRDVVLMVIMMRIAMTIMLVIMNHRVLIWQHEFCCAGVRESDSLKTCVRSV